MEARCNKHSKAPHWSGFPLNPCFPAPVEHCTSGALLHVIDKQTTLAPVEHCTSGALTQLDGAAPLVLGCVDALQRSAARLQRVAGCQAAPS